MTNFQTEDYEKNNNSTFIKIIHQHHLDIEMKIQKFLPPTPSTTRLQKETSVGNGNLCAGVTLQQPWLKHNRSRKGSRNSKSMAARQLIPHLEDHPS